MIRQRLSSLCEDLVALLGDPDAAIQWEVSADTGPYSAAFEDTLLRVTRELVGNAVQHGLRGLPSGRIEVMLRTGYGRAILTVTDDGRGYGDTLVPGDGLALATRLAGRHGGSVRLLRQHDRTLATLELPYGTGRPE